MIIQKMETQKQNLAEKLSHPKKSQIKLTLDLNNNFSQEIPQILT